MRFGHCPRAQARGATALKPVRRLATLLVASCAGLASAQGTPPAAPRQDAPYTDRTLLETAPEIAAEIAREEAEEAAQPDGRRGYSARLLGLYRDPNPGPSVYGGGLSLAHSRDTRDWGLWRFEADIQRLSDYDLYPSTVPRITLYSLALPVTGRWLADTSAGVARTSGSGLMANSYRVYLPRSVIAGATTRWYDERNEVYASAGETGSLFGAILPQYRSNGGELAGFGWTHTANPQWRLGVEFNYFTGSTEAPEVPENSNYAGVVEYSWTPYDHAKLHLLGSSNGGVGGWTDWENRLANWTLRYGAYGLSRTLLYNDAFFINNQRGAYFRSDYYDLTKFGSVGIDAAQINPHPRVGEIGTNIVQGLASGTYRLGRRESLGGTLNVLYQSPIAGEGIPPGPSTVSGSVSAYYSMGSRVGTTQIQYTHGFQSGSTLNSSSDGVSWTQDWPLSTSSSVGTTLGVTRESLPQGPAYRWLAALRGHAVVGNGGSIDGNISWNRFDPTSGSLQRGLTFNLYGRLPFARNWALELTATYDQLSTTPVISGGAPPLLQAALPATFSSRYFLLGIRYQEDIGRPFTVTGSGTGLAGTGDIEGRIFLDENGDGRPQPDERGARGITVLLDGRVTARTDADGRFSYSAVPTGRHSVTIAIDTVPLPWAPRDEAPQSVDVPLRGTGRLDVGLTRLR